LPLLRHPSSSPCRDTLRRRRGPISEEWDHQSQIRIGIVFPGVVVFLENESFFLPTRATASHPARRPERLFVNDSGEGRAGNNDERYSARFKVAGTRRLRRACN